MQSLLIKGNEALAEGAIRGGCRFYAGYPITPQSEILEMMAWRQKEVGGVFIQGESEIASVNMVMGASALGARAMTSRIFIKTRRYCILGISWFASSCSMCAKIWYR